MFELYEEIPSGTSAKPSYQLIDQFETKELAVDHLKRRMILQLVRPWERDNALEILAGGGKFFWVVPKKTG